MKSSVRLVVGADFYVKSAIGSLLESSANFSGFRDVLARIAQSDICFVNLEMVLTTVGYSREKSAVLYGHPEIAKELKAIGVDIVTLANNHMLDRGIEGLFTTLEAVDRHGVLRVGAGKNLAEAQKPCFVEANGIRTAFLAFSAALPLGAAAAPERPGVNPLHVSTRYTITIPETGTGNPPSTLPMVLAQEANTHDLRALVQSVEEAKQTADRVIVAPHWGVVGQDRVMPYQEETAHALIDAGADAVVGHHPHRLHGVEVYKGCPIFYSLGNFIFHPLPPTEIAHLLGAKNPGGRSLDRGTYNFAPENALVEIDFDKAGVLSARVVPIYLNAEGEPMIPEVAQATQILDLVKELSLPYGTQISADGLVSLGDEAARR